MSIAVDLDGTLAEYDEFEEVTKIGAPVPVMEKRVRGWIAAGKEVVIFSARAGTAEGKTAIEGWLKDNGFPALEVTDRKSPEFEEIWDDRAVQVEKNTGRELRFKPSKTVDRMADGDVQNGDKENS
jgi:phosphoglycolate phosphatase-like HAD superfamily hydrolase